MVIARLQPNPILKLMLLKYPNRYPLLLPIQNLQLCPEQSSHPMRFGPILRGLLTENGVSGGTGAKLG